MADKSEINNEDNYQENYFFRTMTNIEFYPAILDEQIDIRKFTKLPLSKISALGIAFEPLEAAFQYILNKGEAGSGLYRVTIPQGSHLAKFTDGSGFLGSVLKTNGAMRPGQARLNPLIIDPKMIFMAAVFANIDNKLDRIFEMQQELMDFMVRKERSELRGDLNYLSDILNNYKYNWNNDKYKNNNHIKVLDIKETAERKIDFYRDQIVLKIQKRSFLHTNQEVKNKLEKLQSEFKDYQLALYLYSFSSFLEIMLLENYSSMYLDLISGKIEGYLSMYRDLNKKCFEQIEGYANSSIESHLFKGLAFINKTAGDSIAKVPVISKSQIDETLIKTGEKLEKISSKRTDQTLNQYLEKQSSFVLPFVENIKMVNRFYNQPVELVFDKEYLYVRATEE